MKHQHLDQIQSFGTIVFNERVNKHEINPWSRGIVLEGSLGDR